MHDIHAQMKAPKSVQHAYEKGKAKSGAKIKNEQTKIPQRRREKTGRRRGLERHGGAERLCSKQNEQNNIDKRDRRCVCVCVCV